MRKSNQEAARIKAGDTVRAIIELDEEPRTVDPPLDLMTALKQSHLEADWDKLSYSTKKEFADVLQAAKRPETRARRVEKTSVGDTREEEIEATCTSRVPSPDGTFVVQDTPASISEISGFSHATLTLSCLI